MSPSHKHSRWWDVILAKKDTAGEPASVHARAPEGKEKSGLNIPNIPTNRTHKSRNGATVDVTFVVTASSLSPHLVVWYTDPG